MLTAKYQTHHFFPFGFPLIPSRTRTGRDIHLPRIYTYRKLPSYHVNAYVDNVYDWITCYFEYHS